MQRTPVVSTNVSSIGYANGVIEGEFTDGSVYRYFGTNEYVFRNFLNAPSKGRFIHYYLKGYSYQRVA